MNGGAYTIAEVVSRLHAPAMPQLTAPHYAGVADDCRTRVGLAVEDMRNHLSDEGWQIFAGLEHAGYTLCGYNLPFNTTITQRILDEIHPGVVVVQDKREWDCGASDFRERRAKFHGVNVLQDRGDLFTLTILKDAHQRLDYHAESAREMGVNAWITYYATPIVCKLAPYVRPQHVIRTYHTLDRAIVPDYTPNGRSGCLLSGAVSGAYPLRESLIRNVHALPETTYMPHPGYHRQGCQTPAFLQSLTRFKVSICTASRFGYVLRKMVESTAAGCVVVTDLPSDEIMPAIDGNLVRVRPEISPREMGDLVRQTCADYDHERQWEFAKLARDHYDYRVMGAQLARDIEEMRVAYRD